MPVYLAYDGSLNCDWVARYAVRMAAHAPEPRLAVLHVRNREFPEAQVTAGLDRIAATCAGAGLAYDHVLIDAPGPVADVLLGHLPAGPDSYLLCGARVQSARSGFLKGTVSETLMRREKVNVLALRVMQPGLLGSPRRLLMPVHDDAQGSRPGFAFLGLMLPDLSHLHLLNVITVSGRAYRRLTQDRIEALRRHGRDYLHLVERQLADDMAVDPHVVDATVRVSDDWAREVIVQAGRTRAGMIYMEAPRASLRGAFWSEDPVEEVMRDAPCDVGLFRGAAA